VNERDADTAIGGPRHHFPSTRLSLLEAAATGLPNEALEAVAALYWKPVYRFMRIKFRKYNEDAKDLTQGFFITALRRDFSCGSIRPKPRRSQASREVRGLQTATSSADSKCARSGPDCPHPSSCSGVIRFSRNPSKVSASARGNPGKAATGLR
jgi:hypothetical protein